MELEDVPDGREIRPDARKPMIEPPLVRLLSVADVEAPMTPGAEHRTDELFLDVLGFRLEEPADPDRTRFAQRLGDVAGEKFAEYRRARQRKPPGPRVYRAENFALRYRLTASPTPETLKTIQVEVPSLEEVVRLLLERQIGYERFRGLTPGLVWLHVPEPSGHVVEVFEGGRMAL